VRDVTQRRKLPCSSESIAVPIIRVSILTLCESINFLTVVVTLRNGRQTDIKKKGT
jgi:hypothetical protein